MPGKKLHLTDEIRRCVGHVQGKVDEPYAVCVAGAQKAGKAVYTTKGGGPKGSERSRSSRINKRSKK